MSDKVEFDSIAHGYTGGMEDPIKRFIGGSFNSFIDAKVRWLVKDLKRNQLRCDHQDSLEFLDFGCGTGEFLQSLRRHGVNGNLTGCDVSAGMLKEARERWLGHERVRFEHIELERTSFSNDAFDLITASCVFHHIQPARRPLVFRELFRILKPAGRLVIFEHNPLNAITAWMVRRSPIDQNAILLSAGETCDTMKSSGFECIRTNYLLFLPPRFKFFSEVERLIAHVPLGGQYVTTGEK